MIDPVLSWVLSFCMAMLFLTAGWHKYSSLSEFRVIVKEYEILPGSLTGFAATILPGVEIALAGLWLNQMAPGAAALISVGLLATYCLAMGINLHRGRIHISCGCGFSGSSEADQPLSVGLIVRNCVLMLVLLLSLLPAVEREFIWVDYIAVIFASLVAILLYSSTSQLLNNDSEMAAWRNSW